MGDTTVLDLPEVRIVYPSPKASIGYLVKSFYEFVRPRLLTGQMHYIPLSEFKDSIKRIERQCRELGPEVVSAQRIILHNLEMALNGSERINRLPQLKISRDLSESISRQLTVIDIALKDDAEYLSAKRGRETVN